MQPSEFEVIIIKPTAVFLSFLAAQLPEESLPDLATVQIDPTAYIIRRYEDEEATLDEIEHHFPTMFRHEISRWLGKNTRHKIEGSFLDFLCCFKFELHSQIVLMEPTIKEGRQLLCVKPKSVLLKWLKSSVAESSDLTTVLERVNLSHLAENATVVIKNFNNLEEIKPFIERYYQPIFKAEMLRMCDQAEQWPAVETFEAFNRYFAIKIHTQLIHLY